jgi:hypothetical protein
MRWMKGLFGSVAMTPCAVDSRQSRLDAMAGTPPGSFDDIAIEGMPVHNSFLASRITDAWFLRFRQQLIVQGVRVDD